MNGHEKDADKANGGVAPDNTQGARGIFSTPELTVDTEKLAQNTNSSNANTRSRVASIFANTDAGQRSQKLDDAMGMNNVQPAQVTEDVAIDNGPRKKNKLPIIIAIIAFVAVIGGFTVWMVMRNMSANPSSAQTPEEAFTTYRDLLQKGPEGVREDTQNTSRWFITTLSEDSVLSNSEQVEYLKKLNNDYVEFKQLAEKKYVNNKILLEEISSYGELLSVVTKSLSLSDLSQQLLNIYLDQDDTAASRFIEENKVNSQSSIINSVSNSISLYLTKHLSIIKIYDNYGCIVNQQLDYACGMELGEPSTALNQAQGDQNQVSGSIKRNLQQLLTSLTNSTKVISDMLEDVNE